ncbi:MAG: chromate transporter [Alphaproteobacteria bacterium]|nr:chromate transporter [Alphaproteobacteria bacterium]
MKILINLFITFFKTGLFTFGGGYAMLPILKDEVVTKHHFATEDELLNYFSIGQCTPGIIAVNVATFCGYKLKKVVGAIVATLALVLPSLIIITLVASVLSHFMENEMLCMRCAVFVSVLPPCLSKLFMIWENVFWHRAILSGLTAVFFSLRFWRLYFLKFLLSL